MFTVGIFTTHLPYIALVVFYAFFWVFGINKATACEIDSGETVFTAKISVYEVIPHLSETAFFDKKAAADHCFIPPDNSYYTSAIQKIIHKGYYLFEYFPDNFYHVLLSRPPPFSL